MEYTIEDIENILAARSQLIVIEDDQLEKIYQNQETYISFLQNIIMLINYDGSFLMTNRDYRDRIRRVIQLKRFEQPKEVRERINEILAYLNKLETYSEEEQVSIKNQYVQLQEELHACLFPNEDTFVETMAYDAVVYVSLKDNTMEDVLEDHFYLASLNYLLEIVPTFFQEKEIRERANTKINQIIQKSKPWEVFHKLYAKTTKKVLEQAKEE